MAVARQRDQRHRIESGGIRRLLDHSWAFSVWALTDPHIRVHFFLAGSPLEIKPSDAEGRTEPIECSVPAGTRDILVEGQIEIAGNPVVFQRLIPVEGVIEPQAAAEWNVTITGEKGRYVSRGSITGANKRALSGIKVIIYHSRQTTRYSLVEGRTDPDGEFALEIPFFHEPQRIIRTEAEGTQLVVDQQTLAGPPGGYIVPNMPPWLNRPGWIFGVVAFIAGLFTNLKKEDAI